LPEVLYHIVAIDIGERADPLDLLITLKQRIGLELELGK